MHGWYQLHMAVITAHTRGRYDVMTRAVSRAGIEPIIIEDTLRIGEHRGIAKGVAQGAA